MSQLVLSLALEQKINLLSLGVFFLLAGESKCPSSPGLDVLPCGCVQKALVFGAVHQVLWKVYIVCLFVCAPRQRTWRNLRKNCDISSWERNKKNGFRKSLNNSPRQGRWLCPASKISFCTTYVCCARTSLVIFLVSMQVKMLPFLEDLSNLQIYLYYRVYT